MRKLFSSYFSLGLLSAFGSILTSCAFGTPTRQVLDENFGIIYICGERLNPREEGWELALAEEDFLGKSREMYIKTLDDGTYLNRAAILGTSCFLEYPNAEYRTFSLFMDSFHSDPPVSPPSFEYLGHTFSGSFAVSNERLKPTVKTLVDRCLNREIEEICVKQIQENINFSYITSITNEFREESLIMIVGTSIFINGKEVKTW